MRLEEERTGPRRAGRRGEPGRDSWGDDARQRCFRLSWSCDPGDRRCSASTRSCGARDPVPTPCAASARRPAALGQSYACVADALRAWRRAQPRLSRWRRPRARRRRRVRACDRRSLESARTPLRDGPQSARFRGRELALRIPRGPRVCRERFVSRADCRPWRDRSTRRSRALEYAILVDAAPGAGHRPERSPGVSRGAPVSRDARARSPSACLDCTREVATVSSRRAPPHRALAQHAKAKQPWPTSTKNAASRCSPR